VSQFGTPTPAPTRPVADSFGCQLGRLAVNEMVETSCMRVSRKASHNVEMGQVSMAGSSGGFLVGVSMVPGHIRHLKHEHHSTSHLFDRGGIYIRDLSNDYRADLRGAFDFVLLEIPREKLGEFGLGAYAGRISLPEQLDVSDPYLAMLCDTLAPALKNPETASPLYLDYMSRAIGAHLVHRYASRERRAGGGAWTLSEAQTKHIMEYLAGHLVGEISIKALADSLDITPALLIKMFRRKTGVTPYRWVVQRKLERATSLLGNTELPLSEIALSCGFSDQSHFSRVFSSHMGTPPGRWRQRSK
jgi:AraC family transcriptional regulator